MPCVVPSGPCRSPAAGIFMEPAGCPSSAADEQPRLLGAELHQFACAYGGGFMARLMVTTEDATLTTVMFVRLPRMTAEQTWIDT